MFRSAGGGGQPSDAYDEELGTVRAAGGRQRVHGKPAARSRGAVLLWLTVALVLVLYYVGSGVVGRQLRAQRGSVNRSPTPRARLGASAGGIPTRARARRLIHHHSHQIGTDLSDVRFVDVPDVVSPRPALQGAAKSEVAPARVDGARSRDGGSDDAPQPSGGQDHATGGVVAAGVLKQAGGGVQQRGGLGIPGLGIAALGEPDARASKLDAGDGAGEAPGGAWARNDVPANNARSGADEVAVGAKHVGFLDLSDAPMEELYKLTGDGAPTSMGHKSQRPLPSSNADVERARTTGGVKSGHGVPDESNLPLGASRDSAAEELGSRGESLPGGTPRQNPDASSKAALGAAPGRASDAQNGDGVSGGGAEAQLQRPAASPDTGGAQHPSETGGDRVLTPDGQLPLRGLSNPDEQAGAQRRAASPAARVLMPDGQLPLEALRNPDQQAADDLAPAPRRRLLSLDTADGALDALDSLSAERAQPLAGAASGVTEAAVSWGDDAGEADASHRPHVEEIASSAGEFSEASDPTSAGAAAVRASAGDTEARSGKDGSGAGRTSARPVSTNAQQPRRNRDLLALLARSGLHEAVAQNAAPGVGQALAPKRRLLDDSVRCRTSGICDDALPCVGAPSTRDEALACTSTARERRAKVVDAIKWAWDGYSKCAWGEDELAPISCSGKRWFGLGLTLVDSMDTLVLAGLHEEAARARDWVVQSLDFEQATSVNVFETTIRVLGGLLSATHLLGGDRALLLRATELALRLLGAFATPRGLPKSDLDLGTLQAADAHWTTASSLAEMTTLSVEFGYAAQIAQQPQLAEPAMRVWEVMRTLKGQVSGLAPIYIDASKPAFSSRVVTLGARGDSYYEYMLKQWIARGKRDAGNLQMYRDAMTGVRRHLVSETAPLASGGLTYVQEMTAPDPAQNGPGASAASAVADEGRTPHKMDHLVCFLPGVLALGSLHGVETGLPGQVQDLALAQQLMHTCYQMYKQTPTGLAPEIVHFRDDAETTFPKAHPSDTGGGHFHVKPGDAHNLLRPETMESLFVLWRVTRNETYREWGWRVFCAFEMHTRVATGGYASLDSVLDVPAQRRDKMESFFLSETLKYALLLFDDTEVLPLTSYVFNTEGHPVPILGTPTELSQRGWYLRDDDVPAQPGWGLSRASLLKLIRSFRRQQQLDVSEAVRQVLR